MKVLNKAKVASELVKIARLLESALEFDEYKKLYPGTSFKSKQEYEKAMGGDEQGNKPADKKPAEKKPSGKTIGDEIAEKVHIQHKKKGEDFSADSDEWYDDILKERGDGDDESDKKYSEIHKAVSRQPTKENFTKLKEVVKKSDIPGKKKILNQMDGIENGKYRKEFARTHGNTSQTSELFSFLKQAIGYERYNIIK